MDYSETCLSDSVRKYFLQVPSSTTSLNKKETFLLDKLEIDFGRILEIINTEGNITETEAAVNIIPILSQIHQQFLTADIEYPEISGYLDCVNGDEIFNIFFYLQKYGMIGDNEIGE